MASSTSPHAFSDRRLTALVIGVLVAAPLLVLLLLQANYVLAYQACADRSNIWLNVPSVAALLASVIVVALAWAGSVRATDARAPLPTLAMIALLLAVLSLLLVIALALPPLVLHPCD